MTRTIGQQVWVLLGATITLVALGYAVALGLTGRWSEATLVVAAGLCSGLATLVVFDDTHHG